MTARVVCGACGKRLKLPDAPVQSRAAWCPKCSAAIDLTPVLDSSAYLPTLAPPLKVVEPHAHAPALPLPPDAPLSLDDERLSLDAAPPLPAPDPPFRVPVRVLADSAGQFVGPCFAVVVSHGVFLELEPLKPFLYAPVGCPVGSAVPGEFAPTLPGARTVTVRVEARYARPLARDLLAFFRGVGPAPSAADYRRPWRPLWAAILLALGTAVGPLALTQTADVGFGFGLKVGAAAMLVALIVNAGVVALSRLSVLGQVLLMTVSCALVAGGFFFGTTAYLAGRQQALQAAQPPVPQNEPVAPVVPEPPPAPPSNPPADPPRPPSHVDQAYQNGVSALEDGPADVTALAVTADGTHLGIGYADGTTRVWPLEQPTFDSMLPGPKIDGPVSRVQFDDTGTFMFATGPSGVVVVPRGGSPAVPVKLNGTLVAIAPELSGNRIRFAAVRGNQVAHRLLPTAFVLSPPAKAKGFAVPTIRDEITPADVKADPRGTSPTFLAWTPANRLLSGASDGTVTVSSVRMRPEMTSRDHKSPVRVWAGCPTTGEFATGDDKGNVAVWPDRGGKPLLGSVLTAPVTGLSFAPSGEWLAAVDNTGWLAIVETQTLSVLQRKKLSAPPKALAFGPNNDVMILGNGKVVEVWRLRELMK